MKIKNFLKNNSFLILIILLFVCKQILWIIAVPALQTPDADRHFSTVMWYAEPGINAFAENKKSAKSNMFDSTTYSIPEEYKNFLSTIQFEQNRFNPNQHQTFTNDSIYGPGEKNFLEKKFNRHFEELPPTIVKYPFLYYETASWVYNIFNNSSLLNRLYAVKFYNLFLGIITLYIIFKTALTLKFSKKNSSLIAGIITFQPMMSFMHTAINVDVLLILGISLFTLSSILILKNSWTKKNIILILLACLISSFTKPIGIITLPLLAFLFFYKIFVESKTKKMKILGIILGVPSLILLILISKLIPSISKLFPSANHLNSITKSFLPYLQNHFNLLEQYKLFASYWGWFGWLDYPINQITNIVIFLTLIIGIASFIFFLVKKNSAKYQEEKKIFIYLAIILLLFHLAVVYSEFSYFARSGKMFGLQGRYFLPMILPFLLIIIKGYQFLLKRYSLQNILICVFVLMILFNFISIFNYIIPGYYL